MIPTEVRLKIKYGLRYDPSDNQITSWRDEVQRLVDCGKDIEAAGSSAAFQHFEGVESCVYFSEADNVAALLKALAAKG